MDSMTDLTERLRTTRLLSQRNQLALQVEAATTLETLTQENARLREALEGLLAWVEPIAGDNCDNIAAEREEASVLAARKALGGGDE